MLSDMHGRAFEYLRLSITDVCNFSCQYCLPDGYQKQHGNRFLTLNEIDTIIAAFALLGTKKVRITGGEPSLRKDLPEVISIASQQSNIERVALTTNAYRLHEKAKQWRECGLSSVNVSIDSFDTKQFNQITGSSDLPHILKGIDTAINVGLEVKLNLVLMRQYNQFILGEVLDYIKDKPISFRFIELMQTGDNLSFFRQQHVSGSFIEKQLIERGFVYQPSAPYSGPAKLYRHPDYLGSIGLIMPYGKGFCDTCNRLRVSAIGRLHLCLFAEQGFDLREEIKSGDVQAVASRISALMPYKKPSHYLTDSDTGATTHLAMLGG